MSLVKSTAWLKQQLTTIGSSAAGIVAGQVPYPDSTPSKLYDAMLAASEDRLSEKDMNDDMRRGIMTEPLHRQLLEDHLGKKIHDHPQDTFLYNALMPWAHALPDGWMYEIGDDEKQVAEIPVQLKCPRVRSWHEIKLKGIHGYWLLGSQHTLAVTGAPHEQFSVLNVETMRVLTFKVPRDEKLIADLMTLEKKFFDALAARQRPLEMAAPQIEMPELTGELVEIKGEAAANAAATFLAAKAFKQEAEELLTDAETRIKELMGEATVADLPGLRTYYRPQEGRLTFDYKAMAKDGIDVVRYGKVGKPFRTFRAYERNA